MDAISGLRRSRGRTTSPSRAPWPGIRLYQARPKRLCLLEALNKGSSRSPLKRIAWPFGRQGLTLSTHDDRLLRARSKSEVQDQDPLALILHPMILTAEVAAPNATQVRAGFNLGTPLTCFAVHYFSARGGKPCEIAVQLLFNFATCRISSEIGRASCRERV